MAFGFPCAFLDTLFLVGFVNLKETGKRHIQLCTLFQHGFMLPRLCFPLRSKSPFLGLLPLPFPVCETIDYPPRSRSIVFVYSHSNHLLSS